MNGQLSAHQLHVWLTILGWRLGLGFSVLEPLVGIALSSILVEGVFKIVKITLFWFLLCRKGQSDKRSKCGNDNSQNYQQLFGVPKSHVPRAASESPAVLSAHRRFELVTLLLRPAGDAPDDILQKHRTYIPNSLVFQLALHALRRALPKGLRLREGEDHRLGDIGAGAPWLHSC